MNPAETYILNQQEPYKTILLHLQVLIENTVSSVELLYKYKIPFYYIDGRPFCYLNVAKDYVDLGFWNAGHITVHSDQMVTAGRKVMKSLRYRNIEEINETVLIEILENAYQVKDKKFY
ncbi:DUF1801 domain-containing protein [Aquimarina sp. AD10]|uniref:DUF1801 domain-containing protein n=1 Tax=Aquimarina TaxID=290174 RepID=UPI000E55451F|nr:MULTISPECIES: DUF1801 domain-containing protein [Aquimarina]AXT60730.1 DUF1801 domain-containing protein [Aquimarina sp. AD10]RKM95757.1 DUF1801 domain-containing protein [Aquimarina sp. AD10]